MTFFYLYPKWFFGYSIALELLFGLVTALVAFYSWKVYNLCGERECRLLSFAFGTISLSYFVWPLINFFSITPLEAGINAINLQNLQLVWLLSVYVHVILFIAGIATIAYLTFGVKDYKLYSLLVSMSVIAVILSSKVGIAFNFVSAVLLFYISVYYLGKYKISGNKRTFLIAAAFVLLFIARVVLTFATLNHNLSVVDHMIEFVAYFLILLSMVKTMRK